MQKAVPTLMSDADRRLAVESGLDVIGGGGLHDQMTATTPAAGCWSRSRPRPARSAVVCVSTLGAWLADPPCTRMRSESTLLSGYGAE